MFFVHTHTLRSSLTHSPFQRRSPLLDRLQVFMCLGAHPTRRSSPLKCCPRIQTSPSLLTRSTAHFGLYHYTPSSPVFIHWIYLTTTLIVRSIPSSNPNTTYSSYSKKPDVCLLTSLSQVNQQILIRPFLSYAPFIIKGKKESVPRRSS